MCLSSWGRTQKGTHINFFGGDFGGQKGVPNGPFSVTKSLVYCFFFPCPYKRQEKSATRLCQLWPFPPPPPLHWRTPSLKPQPFPPHPPPTSLRCSGRGRGVPGRRRVEGEVPPSHTGGQTHSLGALENQNDYTR